MQLTLSAAMSAASAIIAAFVGVALSGFFGVDRWKHQRLFAGIALSGALFSACDVLYTLPLQGWLYVDLARVQVAAAALNIVCWLRYAALDLGPLPGRWQRASEYATVIGALGYVTPLIGLRGTYHLMPLWGGTFVLLDTRPVGLAAIFVLVAMMFVSAIRYLRAALRRRPYAWWFFSAQMLVIVTGFATVLTIAGVISAPPLVGLGLCGCIALIALTLANRWAADMGKLDQLSSSLEREVAVRTQALEQAYAALARSDRLAAVGRLAGGMAHEINNPGAALIANLEYLLDAAAKGGGFPPDTAETLDESLTAARRISNTVRQLLLISRAAAGDGGEATFNLGVVVQQALGVVERTHGSRVPIAVRLAGEIVGRGRGLLLEQVLVQLLSNAVLSIPAERADGAVRLEADCDDGVLVLRVIDNGVGMSDVVRERLFEPFFTTRRAGEGSGLGLAVSLGLLQALGGEVRVESYPDRGTTMTLVLEATRAGEPALVGAPAEASTAPPRGSTRPIARA